MKNIKNIFDEIFIKWELREREILIIRVIISIINPLTKKTSFHIKKHRSRFVLDCAMGISMILENRPRRFRYGPRFLAVSFSLARAVSFFSPASWKPGGLIRHRFAGDPESNLLLSPFLLFSSTPRPPVSFRPREAAAAPCGLPTNLGVGFSDFHGFRGAIPLLSFGPR